MYDTNPVSPVPQRQIVEVIFPNGKPDSQATIFIRAKPDGKSTVYGHSLEHPLTLRSYCLNNPQADIKVIPHDSEDSTPFTMTARKFLKVIGEDYISLPHLHPNGQAGLRVRGLEKTAEERWEDKFINHYSSKHLSTS